MSSDMFPTYSTLNPLLLVLLDLSSPYHKLLRVYGEDMELQMICVHVHGPEICAPASARSGSRRRHQSVASGRPITVRSPSKFARLERNAVSLYYIALTDVFWFR